jgi:hypothetical protein
MSLSPVIVDHMPFGDGRDPYPDATVIGAKPGGWATGPLAS